MAERRVTLGRVAGVFGVRGWVKVHSHTRPPENILKYKHWWLEPPPGRPAEALEVAVHEGRPHGRGVVAQLERDGAAIEDRDQAESLIGWQISVERKALPRLPRGQYYWVDLIGSAVENVEGAALGTVSDMTSNGAQDVMVVMDGQVERMIPFVHGPIVKKVDLKAGRIVCDWQADWV